MSYCESLEAAGATVHNFQDFGSYQGTWWAKVTYKGETGFVEGSYGSCSGCDSFQAEFDCDDKQCPEHRYRSEQKDCEDCKQAAEKYAKKMEVFGLRYIDGLILSTEEAIKKASENIKWDEEAKKEVEWIKSNS